MIYIVQAHDKTTITVFLCILVINKYGNDENAIWFVRTIRSDFLNILKFIELNFVINTEGQ